MIIMITDLRIHLYGKVVKKLVLIKLRVIRSTPFRYPVRINEYLLLYFCTYIFLVSMNLHYKYSYFHNFLILAS